MTSMEIENLVGENDKDAQEGEWRGVGGGGRQKGGMRKGRKREVIVV